MEIQKRIRWFTYFRLTCLASMLTILDPSYTPTQVILTVIFAYLGMRLI